MKSLQLRLGMGLLVSLIIVFTALWWLNTNSIRRLTEDNVAAHLEHDAESILAAIYAEANAIDVNISQIEPVYLKHYSGQYYQVSINGQMIRSLSMGDKALAVPALPAGAKQRLYQTGPEQQPLLIMVYGYRKLDQPVTVAVAEDLSPALELMAAFQSRYAAIALVWLLLLITVQIIIFRSGFRPLHRIQAQLRALGRGERTQIDTDVPQEVAALVAEFNWLLNVLDQRAQRSRNALADLAHALTTPLTVLQQLPREDALHAHPEICDTLRTQTANMQKLMERVLKRARLAGSGPVLSRFDIQQEIPALLNVLNSMYRNRNLTIIYAGAETGALLVDREDMLELMGNLLDNACKWAKSRVRLTLYFNRAVHLIVEDDGPGVSEADIARLAVRGKRLDETVAGHGLGLSIARLIAEQYGGRLILRRSENLGGFCAEAILCVTESL